MLIYNVIAAFFNLIIGFWFGWKLSLVIVAMSPLMIVASFLMTKVRIVSNFFV